VPEQCFGTLHPERAARTRLTYGGPDTPRRFAPEAEVRSGGVRTSAFDERHGERGRRRRSRAREGSVRLGATNAPAGPYDQHPLTDLYVGFGLLFAWATVTLGRELALAVCAGWAFTRLLPFIYPATHLADFTVTQATEQTAGLAAYLLLLVAARSSSARPTARDHNPGSECPWPYHARLARILAQTSVDREPRRDPDAPLHGCRGYAPARLERTGNLRRRVLDRANTSTARSPRLGVGSGGRVGAGPDDRGPQSLVVLATGRTAAQMRGRPGKAPHRVAPGQVRFDVAEEDGERRFAPGSLGSVASSSSRFGGWFMTARESFPGCVQRRRGSLGACAEHRRASCRSRFGCCPSRWRARPSAPRLGQSRRTPCAGVR